MNAKDPDSRNFEAEENDAVWRLLERAPLPEPDGWFTARTLARCRAEGPNAKPAGMRISLTRVWRWVLGGGLALSMGTVLMVSQIHIEKAKQKEAQDAFEIVAASVDSDSDSSSSSSSWPDTSY